MQEVQVGFRIMVNSFTDLESEIFKPLKEAQGSQGFPPVFPVGPVVQLGSAHASDRDHECLGLLDRQPRRSMLFVAFGSGGTHSLEQMKELALGLEMSGQRFLWVARSPNETAKNATYFSSSSIAQQKDPLGFLPDGFLERTKEVGLVVLYWALQVHVLSHESTGGFLTHCGWNSTLESIVNDVPLISWPLYPEQCINAVLLADDMKIAWRVEMNDKGIVEGQDIARYERRLIEGGEGRSLRNKMKEPKEVAKAALSQGGSSTKALAEVAEIWKGHMHASL